LARNNSHNISDPREPSFNDPGSALLLKSNKDERVFDTEMNATIQPKDFQAIQVKVL
jgi:hypothetical protein